MAKGIAHRDWSVWRSEYGTDQDFHVAVQQEMAQAQHIMERLGVAIVVAPARKRGPLGTWETQRVIFKTASVPGVSAEEPVEVDVGHPYEDDTALVEDPLAVAE